MSYQGDINLGDTIDIKFCTVQATGAPTTLAGSPVISAYLDNSTTQVTAGITLSVDFDGVTGLNNVRVVATSGNGFATAQNVQLVITTGTVNSVSAVGYVVGEFSIEKRSALRPTTATRTLDVAATGEAGLDFSNVLLYTTGAFVPGGVVDSGTAQSATGTTLVMRSAAAFADSELVGATVVIRSATAGAGQRRLITANVGSTDTLTVDTWTTTPTGTIIYDIYASAPGSLTSPTPVDLRTILGTAVSTPATAGILDVNVKNAANVAWLSGAIAKAAFAADTGAVPIRTGTAQAGAGTTITLDASASATNSFYNNTLIVLTGGTGVGQARFVTAYVGATKVATVATWAVTPDSTTTFAIQPFDAVAGATAPTVAQIATAVWQDLLAGSDFGTASSIGALLKLDIDAAVSSRMATYTQPTGFLAATFPTTVASTTNITAALLGTTGNNAVADALLDRADSVETGLTPRGLFRLTGAAIAGKASGLATATAVYRNAVADAKARITATVDADGNRTAVTTDVT